ncbi:siderophore biosynthesis protein [Prauserella marina]|uniref:Siderophore synthetase component n=1 Tax=Prauserella marina TaxID=530584 RepID=A0A222W1D8_9PSEU|nr:IucA/IucC family protein [Prauserella marina]ASR39753.1 siderophore biosynthesis protein [Prauserella marina]PWV78484.1 siderophore synthetase component [Prauserella marina]SDC87059.1 Siderophore synthetase component [Prauserella marina]
MTANTTETTDALVRQALASPHLSTVRRRIFRQLLESLLYENAVRTTDDSTIVGKAGVRYTFTAKRRYGFARVAVENLLRDGEEPTSIALFLSEIADCLDARADHLTRFTRELDETLVKDTVARHQRAESLIGTGFDALEGLITDGHRYHPAYKSRVGFDIADNLAYGPEFRNPVRPLWIAVRDELAETSRSAKPDFSAPQGIEPPEDYVALPVHPWQWREHVVTTYAEWLHDDRMVVLGEDSDRFLPQQSIRTLACLDSPRRPNLKLAMSLVNTSTSRVLAPHTVHNAPLISNWLRGIRDSDPFLRDESRPLLLGEFVGTSVSQHGNPGTYGTLACIWRESLPPLLDPGEEAVPFTGLTARDVDGTPLIEPWVSRHGLVPWLRQLIDVAVLPVVHLLTRHGVALEAHAQNMVLLHSQGMPTRVALRDFHDGIRFSRAHLADPARCPVLRATPGHHENRNSFVETDDPLLVADFVLDAFFFINMGELAIFLSAAYDLPERHFWALVREVVKQHEQRFGPPAFDIFTPEIAVEKLTTRRLLPDTELRLHRVPNPLADA